ncbi:hypothetical protein LTR95_005486 [Oleoguttula sp. CCFEE 5521]
MKINDSPMLRTATEKNIMLHAGSMNKKDGDRDQDTRHSKGTMFVYSSLHKSGQGGQLSIRETSHITALQAALFGGPLTMQSETNLYLNDWLINGISGEKQAGVAMKLLQFRDALQAMHTRAFRSLGEQKRGQVGFGDDKPRDVLVDSLVKMLAPQ